MFGFAGRTDADLTFDATDSAPFMPKAIAVAPAATAPRARPPRTLWSETIIYELHVRGFTKTASRHARGYPRNFRRSALPRPCWSISRSSA